MIPAGRALPSRVFPAGAACDVTTFTLGQPFFNHQAQSAVRRCSSGRSFVFARGTRSLEDLQQALAASTLLEVGRFSSVAPRIQADYTALADLVDATVADDNNPDPATLICPSAQQQRGACYPISRDARNAAAMTVDMYGGALGAILSGSL